MSRRGEDSQQQMFRQTPSDLIREKLNSKVKESPKKPEKKNIMKILDDLVDDEEKFYQQEFESYRE